MDLTSSSAPGLDEPLSPPRQGVHARGAQPFMCVFRVSGRGSVLEGIFGSGGGRETCCCVPDSAEAGRLCQPAAVQQRRESHWPTWRRWVLPSWSGCSEFEGGAFSRRPVVVNLHGEGLRCWRGDRRLHGTSVLESRYAAFMFASCVTDPRRLHGPRQGSHSCCWCSAPLNSSRLRLT